MSARNRPAAKAVRRAVRAYQDARKCGHCTGGFRQDGPHGPGVYHDPGCPVLSGAVDPGADGRRAAAAASEQSGIPVIHPSFARHTEGNVLGVLPRQPVGPRAAEIVEWFIGRMHTPMEFCPHLDADKEMTDGNQVQWAAWDRERLLCTACFLASEQRVNQTREDATCDYCRQYVPAPEGPAEPRLYAMIVDLSPVTLQFGLCPECYHADQAGNAT